MDERGQAASDPFFGWAFVVLIVVLVGMAIVEGAGVLVTGVDCAGFGGCQGPDNLLAGLAVGAVALGVAGLVYRRWGGAAEPEPSNVVEAAEVEEPPRP